MDRYDRLRARRHRGNRLRRIDVEGDRIDVDQHGPGTKPRDGAGGGEKRVRRRDHLIAGLDVEHHQREQHGVGARRQRDGMAHAEHRGELVLERVDLRAHDEPLAVRDARHRLENLVADRPVLGLEVEQRDLHRALF